MSPLRWMWPGMMPILSSPGVMTPGQLGPTKKRAAAAHHGADANHVEDGDAFGDADDEVQFGVDGFFYGGGGEGRGDIDDGDIGVGGGFRFGDGVEDGDAFEFLAAFSGGDAGDIAGAAVGVGDAVVGVEAAVLPVMPCVMTRAVAVDEDGHARRLLCVDGFFGGVGHGSRRR